MLRMLILGYVFAIPPAMSRMRSPGLRPSNNHAAIASVLFAHLKRTLKLDRLRLRGPRGAQDELTLAAIAQNLRRLAKLAMRPPPITAAYLDGVGLVEPCPSKPPLPSEDKRGTRRRPR